MRFFVKIKHWQLFILFIGIFITTLMSFDYMTIDRRVLYQLFNLPSILPVMLVLLSWLYVVGVNLYKISPVNLKMNLTMLKISLLVPILFAFFIGFLLIKLLRSPVPENTHLDFSFILLIFCFHFLSSLCILYGIYFTAKALKSVELKREANFNEYIVEIILLAFLVVGLWIVQPRINKIFDKAK
jgi:hypothetical protein